LRDERKITLNSQLPTLNSQLKGTFILSCFSKLLSGNPEYLSVQNAVKRGRLPAGVLGLSQIPKAHLIHTLCEENSRRALVVLPDESSANRLAEDLKSLGTNAHAFCARDFAFRNIEGQSREYERKRLGTLGKIIDGDYTVITASVEAALQFTMPAYELKSRTLKLKTDDEISQESVIAALIDAGYVRAELVEGAGQFAKRGFILDFFPPDGSSPVRVEFFGDNIDSIAVFDALTQRRGENLKSVKIIPATEIICENETLAGLIGGHAALLKGKTTGKARDSLLNDADMLKKGVRLASVDRYIPLVYANPETIFDYCRDDMLFVSETGAVKEKANLSQMLLNEEIKTLFEEGCLCKGLDRFTLGFSSALTYYERRGALYLDNFARGSFDTPVRDLITFNVQQHAAWNGSLNVLLDDIRPALSRGVTAVIMAGTKKAAAALAEDLINDGINCMFYEKNPSIFTKGRVNIIPGALSGGFEYPQQKIMLISFARQHGDVKSKPRNKARKAMESFNSLEEIKYGDYIVHATHGIGIFDGIRKMDVGGITKDYIKIKYAANDILYVPVTQLDLVSKYIGPHSEDGRPLKINRLGSSDWAKAKTRVQKAVKDMAAELTALYSKRINSKGFAFSRDIDMQSDFERRFEFDETEDQLRCIHEIKKDMEQPYPMDRLLCGDVGFGKTEVALRAAFKCVADGKQCAVFVPTTILALQHYQTIMRRIEGFPVETEMLSRFRTPKQQEKILKDVKRGFIDIIVGTHRLISKDVKFKDLGLVIVDEEQRFGVQQKEKLKELFPEVDVLTLTATPIPRTLNMAMSGIRDMSVIEEAPQDRYPVQTYVMEHNMPVITEAIARELRRGGQVYYLHNRVETIDRASAAIKEYLPDARIGIAHGKMEENELSEVWRQLLEGEIDVLACTTIIETGVDVPNVNTLIIENSDRLGLAQLHQIRGRVGRSARRASAYLTFVRGKELTEIAQKRLETVREYTEFGSGFKIAMRDLEIRGAGNLLGAQQHGHMEAVGYEMYIKLLSQAVNAQMANAHDMGGEKGIKPAEKEKECLIDIQIDAHIPEKYIESLPQRLAVYRRIADIRSQEDAEDVLDELIDRYGEPGASVKGLIKISLLRNTAANENIYEVGQRDDSILLYPVAVDMGKISVLSKNMRGRIMVSAGNKPYITIKKTPGQSPVDTLEEALKGLAGRGKA